MNNNNRSRIKQSDCNLTAYIKTDANKAVQNTVEQNKVGVEVITGRIYYIDGGDFITIEGRLYYTRGETFSWGKLYHVTPAPMLYIA